jgi:hypothetical protein
MYCLLYSAVNWVEIIQEEEAIYMYTSLPVHKFVDRSSMHVAYIATICRRSSGGHTTRFEKKYIQQD